MLQILIWAVCVVIIGIGYCGMYLEKLFVQQSGAKKTGGVAFMLLMFLLAVFIFALSVMQTTALGDLLKR